MKTKQVKTKAGNSFLIRSNGNLSKSLWEVFLSRDYAPDSIRSQLEPCKPLVGCFVRAKSREEAAQKVWSHRGKEWLSLVDVEHRPYIKKISLHVGRAGSVESAFRHSPIMVWERYEKSNSKSEKACPVS